MLLYIRNYRDSDCNLRYFEHLEDHTGREEACKFYSHMANELKNILVESKSLLVILNISINTLLLNKIIKEPVMFCYIQECLQATRQQ